jgi:hypothetical protein
MFAEPNLIFSESLRIRSESRALFEVCRISLLQTFKSSLCYLYNPNTSRNKNQWGEIYQLRFLVLTNCSTTVIMCNSYGRNEKCIQSPI